MRRRLYREWRRAALSTATLVALGAISGASARRAGAASPPSAEGAHVAVAADQAPATEAALEVLRKGGSAADGAIAAALALGVVNPLASGMGGGGFALVYSAREKRVHAIDFRETAPAKVDASAVASRRGARGHSIGVPGEPAGLAWLHARYGKTSLAVDAAPAIRLADKGAPVPHHIAKDLPRFQEYAKADPAITSLYYPRTPLVSGSILKRPDLAATLRRFAAEGAAPFYSGDIAAKIVASTRAAGGTLEAGDLARYAVRERAPLTRVVGTRTIVTMPAPSAGGLMLEETLAIFGADAGSPLKLLGFGSAAYLHAVGEAMRGATADRARFAADPDADAGVTVAYDRALSPENIAARRAAIDSKKTHAAPEFKSPESGTSHLVVADAEGNVVSLTTTVNGPFGARVVAGDTGIVLNNQLDDFSAIDDVSAFGVKVAANRPRPGARPVSSMAPTIVFEGGEPILALGGSGGMRISTEVTQAALARLVFGLDPAACVSSPRIHVGGSAPDMFVDPDITEDVRAGLKARGENLKEEIFLGSAVQMVAWDRAPGKAPRILAASDPRKEGLAVAE